MFPIWAMANWRLIAYGVAAAGALWLGLIVRGWHSDSLELKAAQTQLQAEQDCVEGSACLARVIKAQQDAAAKQYSADREVLQGYETGLKTVSDYAAAHPAPSVRLCKPASGTVVRVPNTPGPADGPAPGGDVPLEAGADIGRQLFDLADAADREAVKLKSLQDWNRSLSQ